MTETLAILRPLTTARLDLRPLRRDDAESLREMTDHPAITGPIHFLPDPFTLADAEALIVGCADGRAAFLGAWIGADLIAVVGAHLHGENEVEIGYLVRADRRGRGFATEAVTAVLDALRHAVPHRAITAECRRANAVSWHMLERLGFRGDETPGRRPGRERLIVRGEGEPEGLFSTSPRSNYQSF